MKVTFHWKALILGVFICFAALFTVTAQEAASSDDSSVSSEKNQLNLYDHEVGLYFKDYFPVARMHNHSYNFLGGGLSYAYHSPLIIPVPEKAQSFFGEGLNVGFSGRFDVVGAFANDDYVNSWCTANLFGGVFLQWAVNEWFEIQPSIEYGLQFDNVKSERTANGLYVNQALQFSPTFKFRPALIRNDGLSIEISPSYTLGFEPDGIANYFGLRFGIMYRFNTIPSATTGETNVEYVEVEKVVEKEVIKEVIKEVPVEKIVEKEVIKEVIKEVPVEKIVEKEVIKYVEKEASAPEPTPEPTPEPEPPLEIIEAVEGNLELLGKTDEPEEGTQEEAAENSEEQTAQPEPEEAPAEVVPEVVKEVKINLNEDGSVAINIPNLLFVSDKAELTDAKSNKETIQQLFEILSDPVYKDFKCVITGYVNPDNYEWTQDEKNLAFERAETVSHELTSLGLDSDTFIIQYGSGKTENKEYNRRVEFKLIK